MENSGPNRFEIYKINIMRIDKDNLINLVLNIVVMPFYTIWLFIKWIISQIVDLISMIFNSFKSQLSKFIGGIILLMLISWFFSVLK